MYACSTLSNIWFEFSGININLIVRDHFFRLTGIPECLSDVSVRGLLEIQVKSVCIRHFSSFAFHNTIMLGSFSYCPFWWNRWFMIAGSCSNWWLYSCLQPGTFPKSLCGYVERALARCKGDAEIAASQAVMGEVSLLLI